jgi:hypothetical protein
MVHTLLLLLVSQLPAPDSPAVRVWLGAGPSLAPGDEARVYVRTSTDGHLVVLHARTDGRVEVLFPGDPASDPFVRAGTYEIPFASSGPEGPGMVVAALSPDPIWFDEFVHDSMWDAAALTGAGAGTDPEALLTDVVQRMLGDGSFNYDVVTYTVAPPPAPIADVAGDTFQPAGVCIECFLVRPFSHRRRRAPAAIAVYSVHRSLEPLPVRAPRPVAPSTPRHRSPEPGVATVRAIPLVARTRPAAAQASALAARSLLLVRVVHRARSNEPATASVVAVSARALGAPTPISVTGGLVAVPVAPLASRAVPEPVPVVHPGVRTGAARTGTAQAGPAPARAGSSTGVSLEAVHTAGWRH